MSTHTTTTSTTHLFGVVVHVQGAVVGGEAFAEQLLAVVTGVPGVLRWVGCDGAEI